MKAQRLLNGRIAHRIKETAKKITGKTMNIILFELWGMINCFRINFIPSLIGCNKPNQPTLYGPLLLWAAAMIKRSNKRNEITDIRSVMRREKEGRTEKQMLYHLLPIDSSYL